MCVVVNISASPVGSKTAAGHLFSLPILLLGVWQFPAKQIVVFFLVLKMIVKKEDVSQKQYFSSKIK